MYVEIQQAIRDRFSAAVRELFGAEISAGLAFDTPPQPAMGDLSIAACFALAKELRRPPRQIAEKLAAGWLPISGVERVTVAGAGYLNFHLDRAAVARGLFKRPASSPPREGKVLVEHTSINPNKAAHIGHLRNAVLGDTFVRLLRYRGHGVEVQNYIDNTGVQVADVVVGFVRLEKKSPADVRRLIEDPAVRFDYYCWDLYARVFQHYAENKEALGWRADALKAIEEGEGEMAAIADVVSTAIVRTHLATMLRLNVRYDLLVRESEILRLDFWKSAFERMKTTGAIRFENAGKNAGCWVMDLGETGGEPSAPDTEEHESGETKIIVRSNGTVTYVGKDIAYHMWKFNLLGKDFGYAQFSEYADGRRVWQTAVEGRPPHPFGRATAAYAVIDTRQAYLQNVVAAAFKALGFIEQANHLHHFAYEVVGLTPRCAEEMGYKLDAEDRARPYIEVSGRKGLGIKADDLMDRLIEKAAGEVEAREMTPDAEERRTIARMIATAALRYFLAKFSRRVIIAFDFNDALAFEGEAGPYLQYSLVRARNIFRKLQAERPEFDPASLPQRVTDGALREAFAGSDGEAFWELTALAAQLELSADQAIATTEPAVMAKYAFRLAQSFNNFYHRFHILSEPDPERQSFLLYLVALASHALERSLDLLGIEVPDRM